VAFPSLTVITTDRSRCPQSSRRDSPNRKTSKLSLSKTSRSEHSTIRRSLSTLLSSFLSYDWKQARNPVIGSKRLKRREKMMGEKLRIKILRLLLRRDLGSELVKMRQRQARVGGKFALSISKEPSEFSTSFSSFRLCRSLTISVSASASAPTEQ